MLSEQQLQYKVDNDKTVFEVLTSVLELGLYVPRRRYNEDEIKHPTKQMTQVKNYIQNTLVPIAINKSLGFVTPHHTLKYMRLFEQAMHIEGHMRDYHADRMSHLKVIQGLHQQLIDC